MLFQGLPECYLSPVLDEHSTTPDWLLDNQSHASSSDLSEAKETSTDLFVSTSPLFWQLIQYQPLFICGFVIIMLNIVWTSLHLSNSDVKGGRLIPLQVCTLSTRYYSIMSMTCRWKACGSSVEFCVTFLVENGSLQIGSTPRRWALKVKRKS